MLPGMSVKSSKTGIKPRITIVGAGNLASALAVSLHKAGYVVDQIISRGKAASLKRARGLAEQVGANALTASGADIKSDVVWFCVPDGVICKAAKQLRSAAEWKGRLALHSSGVLTCDELSELRRRGAAVASVHPLMTFVRGTKPRLAGVAFAIEGDAAAVRVAGQIVKNLGGNAYSVQKEYKAAYHAWGTFASPLLTALLATCERVAGLAGVNARAAKSRMLPILKQTLENYANGNAASAFSGPVVRGDVKTIRRHLAALRLEAVPQEVYIALLKAALAYLPGKKKKSLAKFISSSKSLAKR